MSHEANVREGGGTGGYSGNGLYNFAVNKKGLEEIADILTETANNISSDIESIYSEIDKLENDWSGLSYDALKSKCESYKPALLALIDVLNAYASIYNKEISSAFSTLESGVNEAFESIS